MKPRPKGFLSNEVTPHSSEAFDYITELHGYLWRFVRVTHPGASGNLERYLDEVIENLEAAQQGHKVEKCKHEHVVPNLPSFVTCLDCGYTIREEEVIEPK